MPMIVNTNSIVNEEPDVSKHSLINNQNIEIKEPKLPKSDKSANKYLVKFLYLNNPLPHKPTKWQKIKYEFLCPPHAHLGKILSLLFIFLLFYGALWGLVGNLVLPGGNIFTILLIFLVANILGYLVAKIKLPPLFGMLIAGLALRNIPYLNLYDNLDQNWSGALRAGLGLDPVALKRLSLAVIRLAFIPCIIETLVHSITGHYILGLPWLYSIMLGFILSAISPAVIVPCLLHLNEGGYGVDEGIPTLVIAASSLDDILAITGFTIVLGITFSQGSIAFIAMKVPIEAILGTISGIIFGLIFWFLPSVDMKHKRFFRFLGLLLIGFCAMFGAERLHCGGFGPIAVLVIAFVAQLNWRKELNEENSLSTEEMFSIMWCLFQPLLFGLIGLEVSLSKLNPSSLVIYIGVFLIGLSARILVTFFVAFGNKFTIKELLFISMSWLPKATVQAAIGSVPLDTARKNQFSEDIPYTLQILTIAVLSILITAPIGSILITIFGPRWLKRSTKNLDLKQIITNKNEGDILTNNEISEHSV